MGKGKTRIQRIQTRLIENLVIPDTVSDKELVKAAVPLVVDGTVDINILRPNVRMDVAQLVTPALAAISDSTDNDGLDRTEDAETAADAQLMTQVRKLEDEDLQLLREANKKVVQLRMAFSVHAMKFIKIKQMEPKLTQAIEMIDAATDELNIYIEMMKKKYQLTNEEIDLTNGLIIVGK